MSDLVVDARRLTKIYKMGEVEVEALRGATLTIERGRWWRSWGPPALGSRP